GDGTAERGVRADGPVAPRGAERGRPDVAGDRAEPCVPRRRHRRRRVRLQLSGDRRRVPRCRPEPGRADRPGARTPPRCALRLSQPDRGRRHDPGQPATQVGPEVTSAAVEVHPARLGRTPWALLLERTWRQGRTKLGCALVGLLILTALL